MTSTTTSNPDTATESPTPSSPSRRRKKIILLALLLLLGAGLAWGLMQQRGNKTIPALTPPTYLALDAMVVNLSGSEKIAQIGVTLELANEQALDKLKQFLPSLRAKILMLLTQRSAEELLRSDGKEKLSTDIGLEASRYLNNPAPQSPPPAAGESNNSSTPSPAVEPGSAVRAVIFSSFMVQ